MPAPRDVDVPEPERLLRAAAAVPDPEFVSALEARLLPQQRRGVPRAAGVATALGVVTVAVVAASLADAGPLAPSGGDAARARPGCELVYVTEVAPVGEVVRGADGVVRVETIERPAVRAVERCP